MAVPRTQPYDGPSLFSYGFRPFFLFGAIYAGLTILLWVPFYVGNIDLPLQLAPADWHMHETLFGFLPAIMAGFLLTAVPNWTGRLPVNGAALAGLLALWLLGRVVSNASAFVPFWGLVLANLSFGVMFTLAILREILAGKNWRNLKVLVLFGLLLAAQVGFYVALDQEWSTRPASYAAMIAVLMLIMLIGGRIIPSFTRNYLAKNKSQTLPAPFGRFDKLTVIVSGVVLGAWLLSTADLFAFDLVLGAGFLVLAILHLIRLSRWHTELIWRDALLLVLHVGYGFLPFGFALLAVSFFNADWVPPVGAVHALTTGTIGMMVIGVMVRATLGHTGYPLVASKGTMVLFLSIFVAALLRISAAFDLEISATLMHLSHLFWVIGFWGFAALYGRKLVQPRANPKA